MRARIYKYGALYEPARGAASRVCVCVCIDVLLGRIVGRGVLRYACPEKRA